MHYISTLWATLTPAIADHLWQSTLFALVAGLLALAFRKNSACVRYVMWLAASLKFLVPFSLLAAIGRPFPWRHISAVSTTGMYAIKAVTAPFAKPLSAPMPNVLPASSSAALPELLPLLLAVWVCGFLAVFFLWMARWRRISTAIRNSVPLPEGRELSCLRRLEPLVAPTSASMKILLSRTSLEPGVFGIFRPVLLWPHSISEHLDDSHLEAVLVHELCHVRRRDNLTAAFHMLIEAVFWFHPLIWWIGARLVEERERACDEAVLHLGSRRHIYAESILKVCEFCLTSPLTCVSGVTGSDLKKRMVRIMTDQVIHKLTLGRKLLLGTVTFLAVALPITFGVFNATPSRGESQLGNIPKFVSVSIKPHTPETNGAGMPKMMMSPVNGGFSAAGIPVHSLLQIAYHVQDTQIVGEPDWFTSAKYDIEAKPDLATVDDMKKLGPEQRDLVNQRMLQQFLADYFNLAVHQEARDLPVYELLVADGGPKVQKASGEPHFMRLGMGELNSEGTPLSLLTAVLSQHLGKTVVDKTELTGNYAFALRWTPDADEQARIRATGFPDKLMNAAQSPSTSAPPLLEAVQEQLGLKLQPRIDRVQVLVIDHANQPSQE
jgi:bla regulator protein BlaR1